jgi:hypothetical protein
MPTSRQRGSSLINSIAAEEAAGRAMLVQTAAMFYSLRAMPMRRQLLLEMEQLHRRAWLTLRQSEIHALRVVGHMSQEQIRRQELLDQFLFERELLLEPQFIAFEDMTRKELVRGEWGHRKYLFDFAVESRIMLHGEDWLFEDPDELIGHQLYDDHVNSGHPSHSGVQAPHIGPVRNDGFDDLPSEVLDAMFVPSLPPSDRRGWVPGIDGSGHSRATNHSRQQHQSSRHSQTQGHEQRQPTDRSTKPTRPSTASIYRHRDHIVDSPRKGGAVTPGDRLPWEDRSPLSKRSTVAPSRPASARKPQSTMVLIRHASNRLNGENHREQPYFTSHYCTPSPPTAIRVVSSSSTSRPISASRSNQRINHGSPLLMLTGKNATIAQTKEMLRHMPLEEVERLVPMIRLPRLDLSYLATPSKVADREARRLFGPSTSTTPARGRPVSASHSRQPDNSRGSGAASTPPIMSAAPCELHRSHHSIFGEGPPPAFLSFSSPFPTSSLVTLPLESLVAALYALQVEQLAQAPDHVVRLLRQQIGAGAGAALPIASSEQHASDDGAPKKICPWCVAEEHQRRQGDDRPPSIVTANASPPVPSLQPATAAAGQSRNPLSPMAPPQSSNTHFSSGASQRGLPLHPASLTEERKNHSLREHLLSEFPFLRSLHALRDLCHVPLEVLDPQRDREFAAAAKQWKEISSQETSALGGSVLLLSQPALPLGRTPSFNHRHHGNTHHTAAPSQHRPTQSELEARMSQRCMRMAQEYQRGRILDVYPFVPATVDGVPVEELPLLEDAEFCRLAEGFAASESAGRIPTLKHEQRVQVGNVLVTARERFFSYLEAFGRRYQERILRSCCPQLYVTPPSPHWPGPHDRGGHSTEWCAFRSCFALYASPAHTLGIWSDKKLHGHLMKLWNPHSANHQAAGTSGDQLKLFDMILAAARKRRKSLFADAGLQARHHSWSTDELEPYLLASIDSTIPHPSDTLSILRRELKRSSDTTVVMVSDYVARYQHWVVADCIPALIQQPSDNGLHDAQTQSAKNLASSSLAVQYLHQATRDVVDADTTTMWWLQETGGGSPQRTAPGGIMTWDQYLASLPFLRLFNDAAFMNSCAAWIELHREHGVLGDTQSDLQALQQKLCRRAYALASHWCLHDYEEREKHIKATEAAEQRWTAMSERLITQSLYRKRILHLTAEEPMCRRHIEEAYDAHRAELLYELSSRAASEDLERTLQHKERWLFLSVALCRRSEYEHHVVVPVMARLGALAASINTAANELVHARLSVVQHEHVQRHGVEDAFMNSIKHLQHSETQVRSDIKKSLLTRLQQFDPLLSSEEDHRKSLNASESQARDGLRSDAAIALKRVIYLQHASETLFRDEEARRDILARSLLREMAMVSEAGDMVRAKSLMKERRRSSINFHLAQANQLRGDTEANNEASPIRRPGSFLQQRRTDPLTPSPRKALPLVVTPPSPSATIEKEAAASAARFAAHEALFGSEESQRRSIIVETGSEWNQISSLAALEHKRIKQHLRDREIIEKSAPFADIFGLHHDFLDNSALQVPRNRESPPVNPESEDVRQRFFAATSKAQPIDKPYGLTFGNETSKRGASPQTILRKGSAVAPSPPSGKRVKLRVSN